MKNLILILGLAVHSLPSQGQGIGLTASPASGPNDLGTATASITLPYSPQNPPPYQIVFSNGSGCTLTQQDINTGVNACEISGLTPGATICVDIYSGENCGHASNCIIVQGSVCADFPTDIFAPSISDPICRNSQDGFINTALIDSDPCFDSQYITATWLDDGSHGYSRENLSPGTYCIELSINGASCGNGCSLVKCFTIEEATTVPLTVEATITPRIECTQTKGIYIPYIVSWRYSGSVSLNIAGGQGSYTVQWLNSSSTGNTAIIDWGDPSNQCVIIKDECGNRIYKCFDVPREIYTGKCPSILNFKTESSATVMFENNSMEAMMLDNFSSPLESYTDSIWVATRSDESNPLSYDVWLSGDPKNIYATVEIGDNIGFRESELPVKAALSQPILVFPNPSIGVFSVRLAKKSMVGIRAEVFDVLGRLVDIQNVQPIDGETSFEFDLSEQVDGMYILKVAGYEPVLLNKSSH